jgi:hypothetical protein
MAENSNTFKGLAAPLDGGFEITGLSSTLDMMTLTQAGGGTGDFIVCQSSDGTEVFVVEDDGKMTIGGEGLTVTSGGVTVTAGGVTVTAGDLVASAGDIIIGDGNYLRFSSNALTTVVTTGLTRGDSFMYQAANIWTFGYCTSNQSVVKVAFTDN